MEALKMLAHGFVRIAYLDSQKPNRWQKPSAHPSWLYDATVLVLFALTGTLYFTI